MAALGRLVHVSGDLLSKIEKADRRPQPDRLTRLNVVLEADGRIRKLSADLLDDITDRRTLLTRKACRRTPPCRSAPDDRHCPC